MIDAETISAKLLQDPKHEVKADKTKVPLEPGYYAIFIDSPNSFPEPFRNALIAKNTNLIYIGIATKSLKKRLVEQDLEHKNRSTFFRGVAPILGYRPQTGSLIGQRNQNNYFFSKEDTEEVVEWMNEHLSISWVVEHKANKNMESQVIRQNAPLLNTVHNPYPSAKLSWLRGECRHIALTDPDTLL